MEKEKKCNVCSSSSIKISEADFIQDYDNTSSGNKCLSFQCTNKECQNIDKIITN